MRPSWVKVGAFVYILGPSWANLAAFINLSGPSRGYPKIEKSNVSKESELTLMLPNSQGCFFTHLLGPSWVNVGVFMYLLGPSWANSAAVINLLVPSRGHPKIEKPMPVRNLD